MSRKAKKAAKAQARRRRDLHPRTIVWIGELAQRWGLSNATLWRYRRDRKLPPCDFKIGDREGWRRSTIENFEQSGAAAP